MPFGPWFFAYISRNFECVTQFYLSYLLAPGGRICNLLHLSLMALSSLERRCSVQCTEDELVKAYCKKLEVLASLSLYPCLLQVNLQRPQCRRRRPSVGTDLVLLVEVHPSLSRIRRNRRGRQLLLLRRPMGLLKPAIGRVIGRSSHRGNSLRNCRTRPDQGCFHSPLSQMEVCMKLEGSRAA